MPRFCLIFLLFFSVFLFPSQADDGRTTLLKNATVFKADGKWQVESYLLIRDSKISAVGLMKDLKAGIYDREYDLEGKRVYPAFIDIWRSGFSSRSERGPDSQSAPRSRPTPDKNVLPPFSERGILPGRREAENLQLSAQENKKAVGKGFAVLHLVPDRGIIGGRTAMISTAGDSPVEAVLHDDLFMHLAFKPNGNAYPGTYSSLAAEIKQMKADLEHLREIGRRRHLPGIRRPGFHPELNAMEAVFNGRQKLFVILENVVEQRLLEILAGELGLKPIVLLNSDSWRRPLPKSWQPVLKLSFTPPPVSRDAVLGEDNKKKQEKETYPARLAEAIAKAADPVLAAPAAGDYDGLFKNVRQLLAAGVSEEKIIKGLTVNPARLLGIADLFGSLEPGRTASLLVSSEPLFSEKGKVELAWIEGRYFDFSAEKRAGEKPALDLNGRWRVTLQSQMGSFDLTMTIQQQGNSFTAVMTSQMGEIKVDDGFISGDEITFSASTDIGGQALSMSFSGKASGRRIEGSMDLGAMGQASVTAVPDSF